MNFCCSANYGDYDARWVEYNVNVSEHKARNVRITALALGFITIFLFAVSFVLFGLGTLPPTFLMGLGIFPYLGGALLSFVSLGVLCGMLICAAISAVRTCQKEQWQAILKRNVNAGVHV